MFSYIAKWFLGTANERALKPLHKIIEKINSLEQEMAQLSDEKLAATTNQFKAKLQDGSTLDDILPQAFAVVREVAKRTLGMRPFDVQLIGGIVLHRGKIAEMGTGEGKTLASTLPVYLNALTGKGVHLVTVNDYLASRDAEWMGRVYKFLGLSVGCISSGMFDYERQAAYNCDITYGTNHEFGFDYLRDNLKLDLESRVQREFNYAIIDEVDSILIDESRTPLIISGQVKSNSDEYYALNKLMALLEEDDFEKDEKTRNVVFTEKGNERLEKMLQERGVVADTSGLFDIENLYIVHYANQALKAHKLFNKDVDYIVKDGKIMIIDEFSGRIMDGRRYSEGLHQAIEAKEGVEIQSENQTLASITYQNYFRMYPKLAGMTGTAATEANEFFDIYKLEVIEIPTNLPVKRIDEDDEIFRTSKEKYTTIINKIKEIHETGQPILVSTASIERSEYLSSLLQKEKIKHNTLNARYHEKEAYIIAQAGHLGAVTIATNMAGRGTDIRLGGNPEMLLHEELKSKELPAEEIEKLRKLFIQKTEDDKRKVIELGGLFVLGTERHESRRIDNQLRGRSGRQGDPGYSKFYLSLEDDLMRIFASEKISVMLKRLGLKEGEAIIHPWVSKAIEKAQQKVEARNYDLRKNLLKYDDVMNEQRKVIYEQRIDIMRSEHISEILEAMLVDIIERIVATMDKNSLESSYDSVKQEFFRIFGVHIDIDENDDIKALIEGRARSIFKAQEEKHGADIMREASKRILLITLDHLWRDHLHTLDHLRTGINLRAYAQKDPLNEYKIEAFELFSAMLEELAQQVIQGLTQFEIGVNLDALEAIADDSFQVKLVEHQDDYGEQASMTTNIAASKTGRNELCPCGSGKKYKHCHGVASNTKFQK